ncbi:MAG: hypothetical protein ACREQN_02500 [Candidatus Binataceae bacterium]
MATAILCGVLLCAWPVFAGSADEDAPTPSSDTWQQVDESNGQVLELPQVYNGDSATASDDSSAADSADDGQDQNAQNANAQPPDANNAQAQADPDAAANGDAPDQVGSIDDYQNQQIYGPSVVYIPTGPNYGPLYARPGYPMGYPRGWYQTPPAVPRMGMPAMVPGFHGIPPGTSVLPPRGGMTSIMPVRPMMPRGVFSNRPFRASGGMFRR